MIKQDWNIAFKWYCIPAIVVSLLLFFVLLASANPIYIDYTDDEIADAIYLAEGGEKAKIPFGILSVKCDGYDECRQICLNTIRNNRKRFADYGYKEFDTYLEFLASRYAPINCENDPANLNKNWLRNVKFFLERNRKK